MRTMFDIEESLFFHSYVSLVLMMRHFTGKIFRADEVTPPSKQTQCGRSTVIWVSYGRLERTRMEWGHIIGLVEECWLCNENKYKKELDHILSTLCDMSSLLLMMKSGTTTKKKRREAHDMSARLRVSESLCRGEFMIFMECHRYF